MASSLPLPRDEPNSKATSQQTPAQSWVGTAHRKRLDALDASLVTPLGPVRSVLQAEELPLRLQARQPTSNGNKHLANLESAFDAFEIRDGQTLSFHHHYRNGDQLINAVMQIAQKRGLKDLTIAPSSLFPVHSVLVPMIEDGTIRHILTDYFRGPLANAVAAGGLSGYAVLQSHGGRARAIASGQMRIDVAFVAAPLANTQGDTTGRGGALACGPLGYPSVDAAFAKYTVVAADTITSDPLPFVDIPGAHVDGLVSLPNPGLTSGIQSGSTVASLSQGARTIGGLVADAIAASGLMSNGLSLQSGSGGYSLGSVASIGQRMAADGVQGSFLSGGITASHIALHEAGLFEQIKDVQCFDLEAVASSVSNPHHHMMSAENYASPIARAAVVDDLSVMLLGAVEVDAAFNVNVAAGANGTILGGPGGHPDAASGAKLSIVTTELVGGGYAKIVPEVHAVVTPGSAVDLIVTDQGIAVNPQRPELEKRLKDHGLQVVSFDHLQMLAQGFATKQAEPVRASPKILIEARDGRMIDWL